MSKYNYEGPKQFKPISAWGYIGYSILFAIPVLGLILLIVFSISDRNINRRSYARSYFCWVLITIVMVILGATGILNRVLGDSFNDAMSRIQQTAWSITGGAPIHTENPLPTSRPADATAKPAPTAKSPEATESPQEEPAEEQTEVTETTVAPESTEPMVDVQVGGKTISISQSFKDAMDEYEAFFDEYVEALQSGNAIKLSTLALKYAETMAAFEALDDADLSEAEEAYYITVQARINAKLLTVE